MASAIEIPALHSTRNALGQVNLVLFPLHSDIGFLTSRYLAIKVVVYIGTPPKRYVLDLDTGSTLTWVRFDNRLAIPPPLFGQPLTLAFHNGTTFEATLGTDLIRFHSANSPAVKILIGTTPLSGHRGTGSDGILRLAIEKTRDDTVVNAMLDSGVIGNGVFSILSPPP